MGAPTFEENVGVLQKYILLRQQLILISTMRQITQSTLLTNLRSHFSVAQVRIIAYIALSMQKPFKQRQSDERLLKYGETLMNHDIQTILDDRGIKINIPIKEILRDGDVKNYGSVIEAAKKLCALPVEHFMTDRDVKDLEGVYPNMRGAWICTAFLQEAILLPGTGFIRVKLASWVAYQLYELAYGWSTYDFDALIRIKKVTTMRMYIFTNSLECPYRIKMESLRKLYGLKEDQYKNPCDFVRRVLEPARQELEKLGLHSYKYQPYKSGNKILGYILEPANKPLPPVEEKSEKGMREKIVDKLVGEYHLLAPRAVEIHVDLLWAYSVTPDVLAHIDGFAPKARAAANPTGYAIKCIKARCTEVCQTLDITYEELLKRANGEREGIVSLSQGRI